MKKNKSKREKKGDYSHYTRRLPQVVFSSSVPFNFLSLYIFASALLTHTHQLDQHALKASVTVTTST